MRNVFIQTKTYLKTDYLIVTLRFHRPWVTTYTHFVSQKYIIGNSWRVPSQIDYQWSGLISKTIMQIDILENVHEYPQCTWNTKFPHYKSINYTSTNYFLISRKKSAVKWKQTTLFSRDGIRLTYNDSVQTETDLARDVGVTRWQAAWCEENICRK